MKKIFAILVILCLCITCFVACGNRSDKDTTSSSTPNASSKTPLTSEELESWLGGISIEIDTGDNTSSTTEGSSSENTSTQNSQPSSTTSTDTSSSTSTGTNSSTTSNTSSEEMSSTQNTSSATQSRNPQDVGWGPWV